MPAVDHVPAPPTGESEFDARIPFLVIAAAAFVAGATQLASASRWSWLNRLLRHVDEEEIPKPFGENIPPPEPGDPTYWLYQQLEPHRRNFWDAFDWSPFGMEIHHLIEQKIFNKYPGVFEEAERDFFTNLRGIYIRVAPLIHQSLIYQLWRDIYRALKDAGIMPEDPQAMSGPEALALRQELLFWAVVVDILLGDQMNPKPTILDDPDITEILRSLGVSEADIANFRDMTPEQRRELLDMILNFLNDQPRDYRDYFPNAQLPAPWEPPDHEPDPGQEQRYPTSPPTPSDDPTIPPTQFPAPTPPPTEQPGVPSWLPTAPEGYSWQPGANAYGWALVPSPPYAPIPPHLPAAPPGYHWDTSYGTAFLFPNITPPSMPEPPYGYKWEGWGSGYILLPYQNFPQTPSTRPPAPTGLFWAQNSDGFWGLFPYPQSDQPPQQPQTPQQPPPGTSTPGDKPSENSPSLPGIPPGVAPGIPGILPGLPVPPVVP